MHHLEPLLLLLLPGAMVTTPDAPVMVVAVHIYCFSLFVNNHSSQYSPNEKKKKGGPGLKMHLHLGSPAISFNPR